MSLSIEHVIALRKVGIHADTFDEAREHIAKKLLIWGYVDYSFATGMFFSVVQSGRKNSTAYSEILLPSHEHLDECQEELMSKLIEKAKEKYKLINP